MTEIELINKIKKLKEIKPRKDWVFLTKSRIFQETTPVVSSKELEISLFSSFLSIFRLFSYKPRPVLAFLVFSGILIGTFAISQSALPGDFLYPLKKITEKSQVLFVSQEDLPKVQLEIANKRLEELTKIAQENQVKKLTPALQEYQASVVEAAKNLKQVKDLPKLNREIVNQTKKLEEQKQKIEALGVEVGETEELNKALAQLVESQIKDLENRTLTEEQKSLLEAAKEDFQAGNYSQALEKILLLSYQQE